MSTTLEVQRADVSRGAGPGGAPVDEPTFRSAGKRNRRSRFPEVAVGVLVVAAFSLAALWWYASSTEKEAVLALRSNIERGQPLTVDDLQVTHISTDVPVVSVPEENVAAFIGAVPLSAMQAGSLITPDQFAVSSLIPPGSSVVGLSLEGGQIPSLRMRVDDRVDVIEVRPEARSGGELDEGAIVIVSGARVVEVEPIGSQGRVFVGLEIVEDDAVLVAQAAAQGRIRLAQTS